MNTEIVNLSQVRDFFSNVAKINELCYDLFEPYYKQRANNYVFPVFYQSITEMLMCGGFYYKIFPVGDDKVLVVFKKSAIMGNYSIMVHIAPISLFGNVQNEIAIIKLARNCGCSLKLCDEDIRRYRIPKDLVSPIPGNSEYVYDVRDMVRCKGKKYNRIRNRINAIFKREDYRYTTGIHAKYEELARNWDIYKRKKKRGKENFDISSTSTVHPY